MSARLRELDWRQTPMGELSLRCRWDPLFKAEVFEVKLGDEYLMSSRFTDAEVAVATLALERLPDSGLDVVVGGLGLGYTAQTVLESTAVDSLIVVDALDAVIDWHERELIPSGAGLAANPRCSLVHGDFFAMSAGDGFDPASPHRLFDAVIVDIDHSPRHLLSDTHAGFYRPEGLAALRRHLRPGGVFTLWSNDPPDARFEERLSTIFDSVASQVVRFDNPLQDRDATNTVYIAVAAGQ